MQSNAEPKIWRHHCRGDSREHWDCALVGRPWVLKPVLIVIPKQEKKDMLRLAGAELVQVPALPKNSNYVRYSERLVVNWQSRNKAPFGQTNLITWPIVVHIKTTGQKWAIDGGVWCGCKSGGTLAGCASTCEGREDRWLIRWARPFRFIQAPWPRRILDQRGDQAGRITANLEGSQIIPIKLQMKGHAVVFVFTTNEGLCLGGSSGINGAVCCCAIGPGHTIVTFCVIMARYLETL